MKKISDNMTRKLNKAIFKVRKHSPEILVVTGVVGVVTSAVMACKATTKISTILDETKDTIDHIHEDMEAGEIKGQEYTHEDGKKDLTLVYAHTGMKLVKLYGPSVALGVVSLGCIIKSNDILRKRNVALAAAYATVDKGFKEYRHRVIERFGEELDRELKYNIKAKEVEETVIDENGQEKTVKKIVNVYDPNNHSPYAIVFDCGNPGWDEDPEVTKFFLIQQQNYANELFKAKGRLFLNEVYDILGAPRTKAGQVVGWVYDEKNPIGDNFIDFGIFNIDNPRTVEFINGREKAILLDFNVDGNIWDLM